MGYKLPTLISPAGLIVSLLSIGLAATPLQVLAGFTPTPTPTPTPTELPPTLVPTEIPTPTPTPLSPATQVPLIPTLTPVPLLPESGRDGSTIAGAAVLILGAAAVLAGWAVWSKRAFSVRNYRKGRL